MDAKRRKTGDADISELRLRSRQAYLDKRSAEQIALLRRQVAEEADEEERLGAKLSEAERREFARNRQTLRLAEERASIDEHLDGYALPDADYSSKTEVLTRRHAERDYRSEFEQWEDDQARKVAAQIRKPARARADDYEYVFDTSQAVQWVSDGRLDPDRQLLQQRLDAAEQRALSIEETQKSLPVYQFKAQIVDAVAHNNVLIVIGETGSGKTTQIPQYILAWLEQHTDTRAMKVACTQPRRVAAISVAQRVAEEMGVRVGKKCGYMVRFEDKTSPDTKLVYCTDGLLLRLAISDPALHEYGAIIIDEAHERTLSTDVLLGLLRQIIVARPDLKLIISSATLSAQSFSDFFDQCPIFSIPGRTFPVEIMYTQQPEANYLNAALTTIWQIHIASPLPGDILVFLTGEDEIEACATSLEETAKKLGNRVPPLEVRPIYSALPSEEQQRIFVPASPGSRKVVLATNIAETSLTIDGITEVIDPGYEKQNVYDAKSGIESLVIVPCSRASANQRAGRAGRNQPGRCFRLYTKFSYWNELPESGTPEILRQNLLATTLLLKSLGIHDLIHFDYMDAPQTSSIIRSLELLYGLGCLDSSGALTRHGRKLSELPIDPLLGKTILAASETGCVDEIIKIIAILGECHALWIRPKDKKMEADNTRRIFTSTEGGDFLTLLQVYTQAEDAGWDYLWAKQNFLQQRSLNRARDVRDQLDKICERIDVEPSSCGTADHVKIRKALTCGLFPNAARLQRDGQSYRTVTNGMTVFIHPSSVLSQVQQKPKWVIYYELVTTSKEYMRNVMPIEPEWLTEVAPHYYKPETIAKLGVDKKLGKGQGKVGVDR